MKKYLAILLSVVLLLTSIISTSMFSVSAEEQAAPTVLEDNVKLAYWEDQFGNEVQYWPGMDVPSNFDAGFSFVENTSKLPLTSLFKYEMPEGTTNATPGYRLSEEIRPEDYAGSIFYVEIPDFGVAKNQTAGADTPDNPDDDVFEETDQFRFAMHYYGYNYLRDTADEDGDGDTTEYLYNEDGSIKTGNNGFYQYAGQDWFIRGVNDTQWKASGSKTFYGISLPSGWKGYVYIEFNGLHQNLYGGFTDDAVVNSVYLRQLKSTPDVLSDGKAYYGYLPEGKSIVMSEPIWIKGNYADGASHMRNQDVVIDGVAYNLNTGKAIDYSSTPTNLGITKILAAPTADLVWDSYAYGSKTAMPSTSAVTNEPATKMSGFRTYDDTFDQYASMTSKSILATPVSWSSIPSAGGFLFHVDLPALDGAHTVTVNIYGKSSDGTAGQSRSVNTAVSGTSICYLLKDGATEWETRTEGVAEDWIDTYQIKISDGTKPWSGYIFMPKNSINNWGSGATGVATIENIGVNFKPYRHTNKTPNTTDVTGTISAPVIVSNFVSTTTVSYAADGKAVDLASGKVLNFDYNAPAEFVGKTELINNGSATVLELNNVAMKETPVPGTAPAIVDAGLLQAGAKYVHSICPITNIPSIAFKGTVTDERAQAIQYTFQDANTTLYAGDIDGFMFYIKVGAKPVSFGFNAATYITSDEGATYKVDYSSAYGFGSTLPLLAKGATAWTNTTAATPINGVSQVPANFEGYIYIPKFGQMANDLTKLWRLNIYMAAADDGIEETTDDFNVEFTLGALMSVKKGTWTKDYAGMAFVNGSEVAQDMSDGNFVVPNDMNKDMRVNLLDLVKAKVNQKATEFEAFRNSYLETYFNDAEYSVLSAAFSVGSLAYNPEDSSTLLSANPDRGYRSEMVLYFASKPLTIAETPSYTPKLLAGTNYKVNVSANAIYDSNIASGTRPAETETDYNITATPYNDKYPLGDGSGGAVHTLSADTIRAWINAHNADIDAAIRAGDTSYPLSEKITKNSGETEENFLVRAALRLVSDYMRYEKGESAMFVSELTRVVYLTDEQKVKVNGAWSDGYHIIDGVERYLRIEDNKNNQFYYDNTGHRTYDSDGNLESVKVHVYHDPRTIFASDSTAEWNSRFATYFKQYRIGYKNTATKEFYTETVNHADGTTEVVEVANTLFNAYLTFTEFAHEDTLPDGVLTAMDAFFKYCEQVGAKANFRPSYNTYTLNAYLDQSVPRYVTYRERVASECADEKTIIAHIEQMAPVIAANKTAIHNISSGWIGFGGEMASVYQYPPVSYKNVITAMLEYHCIPNGLYFSSRSSSYVTNAIYGVSAVAAKDQKGNTDLNNGLTADPEWAEKYAKWCGFNNDAFFGEQNFEPWGSGDYYEVGNATYAYDNANAAYAPNDGELFTNGSHVYNIRIENGKYVWTGYNDADYGSTDLYNDTDNMVPTPMEAIRELAHHRYTDFSQWHGFLDVSSVAVMDIWMDNGAEWVFEGDVDNVATNGGQFNATERAELLTQAITPALLEANGILYDPAYFDNVKSVNAYEFIRDHLGYRIVADKVTTSYDKRRDDKLTVSVDLKNYGFSAAFNMKASLTLIDANGNVLEEIEVGDPSTWYNLAPDYYTVERNRSAQKDVLTHTVTAKFTPPEKGGCYSVALRLYNSAGTTARLANDVKVTADGYNLLGKFNLINLEGATPYTKQSLKVMSYNIRALRGGDSGADTDPLTSGETATTIANFRSLLSRENPDVMIVCENRMYFDGTATGDTGTKNVYEMLFKEYFPYAYSLTTGASAPRIYSKYELSNPEYIVVDYGDGSVGRRPLAAKIEVSGKEIYIVACHPEAGAEVYESKRVPYFEAIAEWAKDKENVIIAGDMNTDSDDFKAELDLFSEAGFELGNFGDFGTLQTYRFGATEKDKYLDNILSKGLDITNFYVGTETYSDHLPIYAEISLK